MKVYLSPETKSLQVNAQSFICASPGPGPEPTPTAPERVYLPTVTKTNGSW